MQRLEVSGAARPL